MYTLRLLSIRDVGAALKHQWIDRDGLLARMIPCLQPKQKQLGLQQLQEK